ncbi:unnamed protein product, partial [Musa hybrid cultivar]
MVHCTHYRPLLPSEEERPQSWRISIIFWSFSLMYFCRSYQTRGAATLARKLIFFYYMVWVG